MKRSEINKKKVLPWNDENAAEFSTDFVDEEFNLKKIIPNDNFIELRNEQINPN